MRNKSGGRNRRRKERKKWDKTKRKYTPTVYTNFKKDKK